MVQRLQGGAERGAQPCNRVPYHLVSIGRQRRNSRVAGARALSFSRIGTERRAHNHAPAPITAAPEPPDPHRYEAALPRAMPHSPVNEAPGARRIRASPVSKCVRRASHGLDGKAATVDVWKRVAAEEHQVRVSQVDPKGDFRFAVRIAELNTSEAIGVPLKVCKCEVELYRADPFRLQNRIRFPPRLLSGSEGRASSDCSTVAQERAKSNRR